MSDRIAAIEAMLAKSPQDVFLHYSLGIEYASVRRFAEAVEQFDQCINLDSDYIPAHIEAAKALRASGEAGQARGRFEHALELARKKGEGHTADSIRQQIEALAGQ